MARREVFDTRGVVDVDAAVAADFRVRSLERPPRTGRSLEGGAALHVA